MPKKFRVTASCQTAMSAFVNAPDHYTADDVIEWYKENGANGEFEDDGHDWVWGEAQEVTGVTEPEDTIGDAPNMSLQQFLDSKHIGRSNVYYCGGALVIYKPKDNEQDDQYQLVIGNMIMINQLHVLELELYRSMGHNFEPTGTGHFDPDPMHAGAGDRAAMIALLADYCDFFGIAHMSADELAASDVLSNIHRVWFQTYCEAWDNLTEPEILASPYKWVCDQCGSDTVYQETSAYWDAETQTMTMSDGTDETGDWYCGDCGAECCGKKVEIAE